MLVYIGLYVLTCLRRDSSVMVMTDKNQTEVNCCKGNENWHHVIYITKKIIVHTKSWTWKGCVEVIKFSVSLFLFAHPWWVNQGTTGICFAQRQGSFSDSTYCSLVFLFYSLLCSSPSTSSVPSLSFRSLAAWYQVWLILLHKIHSDLGSYDLWSSYLFLFTWERINTCIVLSWK